MTPPKPIPWDEAQERLLTSVSPLDAALVPMSEALGRYLASPIGARRTQPAADLSAMDGYSVRADDLSGPWKVIGESAAGHPYQGDLQAGEAIRISTGALMPAGNCAVLLQENAARNGATLSLNGEGDPTERHIRRAGFDFKVGELLLAAGCKVTPANLALATMAGHTSLSVHRLPRIAILDSGDELAADPGKVLPHQIPASNGPMLAAMCQPFASELLRLGPVADRLEDVVAALREAGGIDVIVTSGGASVGDHDLIRPALEEWRAEIDFWRIAMKPGKPLMVARKGSQTIVGLPGNPVSSYVTAFLFLLPLLRALAGSSNPLPLSIRQTINVPLPAVGKRTEFLRARSDGTTASLIGEQDSSALLALAEANCLIMREAGAAAVEQGDYVTVFPLQNGGIA